jgi:hypothetical protein
MSKLKSAIVDRKKAINRMDEGALAELGGWYFTACSFIRADCHYFERSFKATASSIHLIINLPVIYITILEMLLQVLGVSHSRAYDGFLKYSLILILSLHPFPSIGANGLKAPIARGRDYKRL